MFIVHVSIHVRPENIAVFKDATLEKFNLTGVNSQWTNNLRAVANIVGKEFIERVPVYTLPSNIGTNLLRSMQVQDNGVRLSFGLI